MRVMDDKIIIKMIDHVAKGNTLVSASRMIPGAITAERFNSVINKNDKLFDMYQKAKESQVHHWAEEILTIADEPIDDDISVQLASAIMKQRQQRIDTRRWLASKRLPKHYGDKVDVNVGGQSDNPILLQSITRRIVSPDGKLIDVTPITATTPGDIDASVAVSQLQDVSQVSQLQEHPGDTQTHTTPRPAHSPIATASLREKISKNKTAKPLNKPTCDEGFL